MIRKPEEAKQEEESERNNATSEAVIYTENGTIPDWDNTKEYESKPDDNSEEYLNPGMISSPVGTENAVLIPATVSVGNNDPDLQVDPSLNVKPSR